MKELKPAERLIVAADFRPAPENNNKTRWVQAKIRDLIISIEDTGVVLKVNSALRACGYGLVEEIHAYGLSVFADLKLFDLKETLLIDAVLLGEFGPEIVTVSCISGVETMKAFKAELPDTEVLGVSVLTNLSDDDSKAMFSCSIEDAMIRLSGIGLLGDANGLICSGAEVAALREEFGVAITLNTPAIRPKWAVVKGDDQNPNRAMTVEEAILCGADRIVVGRPITRAENPADAVKRTIDEIAAAIEKRKEFVNV